MELKKAIGILKVFNRWRRGEDIEPMLSPTDIGIAIDTVVNYLDSIREELTYEDRVKWFVKNFYETGMEYQVMLDKMKNQDLGSFKWYDDFIKIPKYKDEL